MSSLRFFKLETSLQVIEIMIDDSLVLAVVGLLCFALGFLIRGELSRLPKKKEQV